MENELVPCLSAPLSDARELKAAFEEAEIPAYLERDVCCGKGGAGCGCAPKMQVLVAREDLPRAAQLLDLRWKNLLAREGTLDDGDPAGDQPGPADAAAAAGGEHEPCPACGTAAPLVAGACSDCGLQLE